MKALTFLIVCVVFHLRSSVHTLRTHSVKALPKGHSAKTASRVRQLSISPVAGEYGSFEPSPALPMAFIDDHPFNLVLLRISRQWAPYMSYVRGESARLIRLRLNGWNSRSGLGGPGALFAATTRQGAAIRY